MSVTPPGQPQQLAAMRRRLQTRARARRSASSGTPNASATAVAASTFDRLPQAEQRRVERGRARRRLQRRPPCRRARGARRRVARDVGAASMPNVTTRPGNALGARHDPRVVGVGDEHVVGAGALEDLGLRVGDRVDRLEEPEMRVADVGPHAHVGLGDADQRADLARMIHAELDDRDLRPRRAARGARAAGRCGC